MMDHIVAKTARSALKFNASMLHQRKSLGRIFKLEAQMKALDRDTLPRNQQTFLYCGYASGHLFINGLNSFK